jgi:hypothetical protein
MTGLCLVAERRWCHCRAGELRESYEESLHRKGIELNRWRGIGLYELA